MRDYGPQRSRVADSLAGETYHDPDVIWADYDECPVCAKPPRWVCKGGKLHEGRPRIGGKVKVFPTELNVDLGGYEQCPICDRPPGEMCKGGQVHSGRAWAPPFARSANPVQEGGPMLKAVQADLDRIGDVSGVPGGHTYVATCLWLARVIDKRGDDEGPAVTAKLAGELTKAMQSLTRRTADGDAASDFGAFTEAISQPVTAP
jgi:hypothetical protein